MPTKEELVNESNNAGRAFHDVDEAFDRARKEFGQKVETAQKAVNALLNENMGRSKKFKRSTGRPVKPRNGSRPSRANSGRPARTRVNATGSPSPPSWTPPASWTSSVLARPWR